MPETDDQLARRLLGKVLDGEEPWTPDMRLRIATVSQAYASLAILDELRRMNDGRDQFQRTVSDFLVTLTLKNEEGSLRSGQPAAAPDGQLCWRACGGPAYQSNDLSFQHWRMHYDAFFAARLMAGATEAQARSYAEGWMSELFGPCPEES